jgi:hypothetical protein
MPHPSDQPPARRSSDELASFLREDAGFEPPASALAAAIALRARVAERQRPGLARFTTVGEWMDLAGARVVDWLGLSPDRALAGVRDDRGDEIVDAAIPGSGLTIVAERTMGEDARLRFIGEFRSATGAPVRGRLAVLDAADRVLAEDELDAFGMFSITLPDGARRVAFSRRAVQATDHAVADIVVIELGNGSRGSA